MLSAVVKDKNTLACSDAELQNVKNDTTCKLYYYQLWVKFQTPLFFLFFLQEKGMCKNNKNLFIKKMF